MDHDGGFGIQKFYFVVAGNIGPVGGLLSIFFKGNAVVAGPLSVDEPSGLRNFRLPAAYGRQITYNSRGWTGSDFQHPGTQ
jgi:hypothetical protein